MMTDGPTRIPNSPNLTRQALADKQAREAREAAALRANLKRRRAQATARRPEPDKPGK